jgi:hypothetical protein
MGATTVSQPRHRRHSDQVTFALEDRGLIDPSRHEEALAVIDGVEDGGARAEASRRHLVAEVVGYVGAAFMVAAVGVFLAPRWDDMPLGLRVGLLVGAAALLAAAGAVLIVTGGGLASLRTSAGLQRRRLASVLFTGCSVAAAAAVLVLVLDWVGEEEATKGSYAGLAGSVTLLTLAAIGYLVAPSLLGQLAVLLGALFAISLAWETFDTDTPVRMCLSYMALGLLWLICAELRGWRETLPAELIGSALLLAGAQALMPENAALSYTVTFVVGLAGFALYVSQRAWPYLALGVLAVTLAVPEALLDWTEGSLGTAVSLLGAGVALLLASLVGMRLHRVRPRPAHRAR